MLIEEEMQYQEGVDEDKHETERAKMMKTEPDTYKDEELSEVS